MLADGLEWAVSAWFSDDWCIRRAGQPVMLCGRKLSGASRQDGFVPVIQPAAVPDGAHDRCVALAEGLHGVCPVCGGDIALDGGRVVAHGQWRVTRDGLERTDEPCSGAGQEPEADA